MRTIGPCLIPAQTTTPARALVQHLTPLLRAVRLWLDADGLRMSAAMSFYGMLQPGAAVVAHRRSAWLVGGQGLSGEQPDRPGVA